MSISRSIIVQVEHELLVKISKSIPVTGGSINRTYCLQGDKEKFFIKINDNVKYPGMFEAEAQGLQLIASTKAIRVPRVLLSGAVGRESYLLLEWIETEPAGFATSGLTGTNLAQMHKCTSGYFGLNHDNYMGSLHQCNDVRDNWSLFFIENRLQPMVKIALDKGLLNDNDAANFEKLYEGLPGLYTEEEPALIHGDLWSGNYMISVDGWPYLIDPAVSFGSRESDIAMTTLFGGFSKEFYQAYNDAFPLNKGWQQRLNLWNLYPLLLHLNLFGAGYLAQVRKNLSGYI